MRLPSSTISSKARLNRKSPTSTLAGLPQMRLAVRLPRRSAGAVDDIVVEQGRGVDELDRGGELVVARAGVVEQSRAREGQHRPHALAAAGDQMAGELGDQRHLRLHPLEDDGVDGVHVGRGQRQHRVERRGAAGPQGMDGGGHAPPH